MKDKVSFESYSMAYRWDKPNTRGCFHYDMILPRMLNEEQMKVILTMISEMKAWRNQRIEPVTLVFEKEE